MLTEKAKAEAAASATSGPADSHGAPPPSTDDLIAYFEGQYVPLKDAKVSIMTHAFMYGTSTFEGIRAYWNPDHRVMYGLKVQEHVQRIRKNAAMLLMTGLPSVDELVRIVVETIRRNDFQHDCYVRPVFYKSSKVIGVRLHNLEHDFCVLSVPFGNYIDIEHGVRLMTSSWRRNRDDALPARGKFAGGYVNMALQKSEAEMNGFEEALVLTSDGKANEASAANLFLVRDGKIITPSVADDILEGITRLAVFELAEALGIPVEVRSIGRSEVYVADEIFLCGTGVQMSPVVEVDHRPIGSGHVGPISRQLAEAYFNAVRGNDPRFAHWLTLIPAR
ncbi:MAG TPA: branched-chain amino acid transaminase [Candidatus Limnocylindrales bacterium]|nr:branched-chain amino acid transaminase [Candidatus Limnocylindrales bacterium]